MIDALPLLLSDEGYQINRSVRLRSSASAFFSRTPASASNRQRFTWSGWQKRGALGSFQAIFSASDGTQNNEFVFFFGSNDTLGIQQTVGGTASGQINCSTNAVFRDPSAWYHIVLAIDTTQGTSANRLLLYVNGVSQTFSSYSVGSSINTWVNNTNQHAIGKRADASLYLDGYLTEINLIDGQQLTPSSFGETNTITGVWQPKKYTGTYGTNGFYLNFSDNSNNTATTIGKDYSGNGNNWTPNNISVTAGVTYDSMLDVPTQWADGGNGRGNYAVLNPIAKDTDVTLSSGNLDFSCTSSGLGGAIGTIAVSSGKWYWEVTVTGGTASAVGIAKLPLSAYDANQTGTYLYLPSGDKRLSPSTDSSYGASYTTNDVIGVALDMDAGTVVFYKNNSSQGTAFSSLSGDFTAWLQDGTSGSASTFVANFGQRPFAYTPPTGFKALNTLNLPTPTILKGNQYFDATLYTGNNSTLSVTNSGSMQPDLVWIKGRSQSSNNVLQDAVRGANRYLISNGTGAEGTDGSVTAFNSNGFSLTTDAGVSFNANGTTYVGWQWKEGPTQGFDIVTYTGNGTNNRTVSHSLGVTPSMVIVKSRTSGIRSWFVAHKSLATNNNLLLQTTDIAYGPSAFGSGVVGNLTSSVFECVPGTIAPNNTANINANGENYVAYLFSEVAGFSKAFSYTGNGSSDGPFVFTGLRPKWVMIKRTDSANDWVILDTSRNTFNVATSALFPNSSSSETSNGFYDADILSNGFKVRATNAVVNASGGTYIGFAFAEVPYKFALGR